MANATPVSAAQAVDSAWSGLLRLGGMAALITLVMIPIQAAVFIVWPPPTAPMDYFALFASNPLLGLLSLDLLYIVDNALLIPVLLALYIALRQHDESVMLLGTAIGLIGIASLFASNPAFDMLALSNGYEAATTEAERAMYLAAGQAKLASNVGSAYQVSYVLGSAAGIIVSWVMLRSPAFGKLPAYFGMGANILGLGLYVPEIGIYLSLLSVVPFLAVWYILVARSLFRLAGTVTVHPSSPGPVGTKA